MLLFYSKINAANYYITTTGSDAATGLVGFPKATLASVFSTYNLAAGDIINIAAGTYTEKDITIGTDDEGFTILGAGIGSTIFDSDQTGRWLIFNNANNDNITVQGITVKDYKSSGAGGGAVYMLSGTNGNAFTSIRFENCDTPAGYDGGAVYLDGNTIAFTGCTFTGCDAPNSGVSGGYGGAIYMSNTAAVTITISKCIFSSNSSRYGSAIGAYTGSMVLTMTITNSLFYKNNSTSNGTIYVESPRWSAVDIINTTIAYNTSTGNAGYISYATYAQAMSTLTNVLGYQNTGYDYYNMGIEPTIPLNNCYYETVSSFFTSTSCVVGGTPSFTDNSTDNYTLLTGSSCKNTGTASGAPSDDLLSATRDATPDIGCYEYIPTTYYSKNGVAPNLITSWNSNRDGTSGSAPTNFTTGEIFVVQGTASGYGGAHTMTTSATWTVSGTGSKVVIEGGGTLQADHLITLAAATTFQMDASATYIHNHTTAAAPTFAGTESFNSAAVIEVKNCQTTAGEVLTWSAACTGGFPSINWNITAGNNTAYLWSATSTSTITINGYLTITKTGTSGSVALASNKDLQVLNVSGNFSVLAGTFYLQSTATSVTGTMSVTGNISVSSGATFDISPAGTGTMNLNVGGNFTAAASSFKSTSIAATLVFNKSGTQTWSAPDNYNIATATINSGSTVQLLSDFRLSKTGADFVVSNGATLVFGTGSIDQTNSFRVKVNPGGAGTETFTVAAGGTLKITSPDGIVESQTTGNVLSGSGSASYYSWNQGAYYHYIGDAAQTTGTALPTTLTATGGLVINNTQAINSTNTGVTLSQATTVSTGTVILTAGILTTGSTPLLTITNTSTSAISNGSASAYVNGPIKWTMASAAGGTGGTYIFPTGKGGNYYPLTIAATTNTSQAPTVEAFSSDCYGTPPSTHHLSMTEYWKVIYSAGAMTAGTVKIQRPSALGGLNEVLTCATSNGSYATLNGSTSGTSITSTTVGTVTGLTKYYVMGSTSCPSYSGTITVGPTGTFPDLTQAIINLTSCGYTGNIILSLQSNYTSASETFPITFGSGLGSGAAKTITVQPGAAQATSISGSNSGGSIIVIDNANYITIEGRQLSGDGVTSYLTVSNTAAAAASNRAILIQNNASNNTIKYSTVKADNSSTTAPTAGVLFMGVGASGNNTISINNCTLTYATASTACLIVSNNTTGTNTSCTISTNTIKDFTNYGIWGNTGVSAFTISTNQIYQSAAAYSTSTVGTYLVYLNSGTSHDINGNYLGGAGSNCSSADYFTVNANGNIYGVYFGSITGAGTNYIRNNTIKYLKSASTSAACAAAGIYVNNPTSATLYITKNTIAYINTSSSSTSSVHYSVGIVSVGTCSSLSLYVNKNTVRDIENGMGGSSSAYLYGIDFGTATSTTVSYFYNNYINLDYGANSCRLYGIKASAASSVFNNTIYVRSTGASNYDNYCLQIGGTVNNTIKNNIFINPSSTAGTTTFAATIYVNGTGGTLTSTNNYFQYTGTSSTCVNKNGTAKDYATWDSETEANGQNNTDVTLNSIGKSSPVSGRTQNLGADLRAATPAVSEDIIDFSRSDATPSIGCYEHNCTTSYSDAINGGPYYIGTTGTWTSLTAALFDLKLCMTGATTLELQSSYTDASETFPIDFSNLPTDAVITLTIRPKSDATGLVISETNATAIIDYNNVDYVTIDGRPGGAGITSQLTIENSNTGAPVVRFINDATNNKLKYCTVSGSYSTGSTILFSTTTQTSGNDANTISNNTIQKYSGQNHKYAIYSAGTAAKTNDGNIITDNKIVDFKTSGVAVSSESDAWTISGNSFYQTGSQTPSEDFYVININAGSGYSVTNNFIGGQAITCGGSAMTIATSVYEFYGITFGASCSGGSTNVVSANTISNIAFTTTTTAATSFIALNLNGSSNFTVGSNSNANIIGANSGTGSISITDNGSGANGMYMIYMNSSGSNNISYNTIGSISLAGSNIASLACLVLINAGTNTITYNNIGNSTTDNITLLDDNRLTGIYVLDCASATQTITNNTIQGLTQTAGAGTDKELVGIEYNDYNTDFNINNNTITNFNSTSTDVYGTQGIVVSTSTSPTTATVNSNVISNLNNTSSAGIPHVEGIKIGAVGVTVSKNKISGLTSTRLTCYLIGIEASHVVGTASNYINNYIAISNGANTCDVYIYGIKFSGGDFKAYYNTINISGTETGGIYSEAALIYSSAGGSVDARNNIFLNTRSGGTGSHFAVEVPSLSGGAAITADYNFISATTVAQTGKWGATVKTYAETNTLLSATHTTTGSITVNSDASLSSTDLSTVGTGANLSAISGCTDDINGTVGNRSVANGGVGVKGCYESAQTFIWDGSSSSDWKTAANWTSNSVPTSSNGAIIPTSASYTNAPIIDEADAVCANLELQGTAILTMQSGKLTVSGTLIIASTSELQFDGGELEGSGKFDWDGLVDLNSGTLDINAEIELSATMTEEVSGGTIECAGEWDGASDDGGFTPSGGTITMDGAASSNIGLHSSANFYNLTIDRSGQTLTQTTGLNVLGNLTITNGTLDASASNYGLNVAGNWSNAGTYTSQSGTVTFNGAVAQTVTTGGSGVGKRFYNLTINNSYGTPDNTNDVDADAIYVSNTLTVTDGQFQPATASYFKDITIDAAGILKPDASATMYVSGNWTNSAGGTFTANSGTVEFNGTSTIITGGSGTSELFYNFILNGTSATLSTNALNVNYDLTLTAGEFNSANRTVYVGHNWVNNATYTSGTSTVQFFRSLNSVVSGSSTTSFYELQVDKGSDLTYSVDISVPCNITYNAVYTNGKIVYNNASISVIDKINPTSDVAATAGFHLINGVYDARHATWLFNNEGYVRISGGTAYFATSADKGFKNDVATSVYIQDGGTVYIAGKFDGIAGSATMSAGTMVVNQSGVNEASYGTFDASTNLNLNISGGTIILESPNANAGGYDINIVAGGTKTITGGTFQIGNASTGSSKTFKINSDISLYNLTVNSTNTPATQLSKNLSLGNNLTNAGAVTVSTYTLNVANNYSGAGTLTVSTGIINVDGGFDATGGAITATDAAAINLAGTTITSLGTYAYSTSTVTLDGASQSFPAATVYNLTSSGSGTKTLGGAVNVRNTLNFAADSKVATGANTLTIGVSGSSNGSITGQSSARYIIAYDNSGTIGYLKRFVTSNSTYLYPIGDASHYTPLTFTLNSSAGLSSADLTVYTKAEKVTGMNVSITNYIDRFWRYTQSGMTTPNYDLTLVYDDADIHSGTTETTLLPIKKSGSVWYVPTSSTLLTGVTKEGNTTGTDYNTNTLKWNGLSTFSDAGGAGDQSVILPITLLSFNANCNEYTAELDWKTASETNNNFFTVERSYDMQLWDIVGTVNSQGNSSTVQSYQLSDNTVDFNNPTIFYRLKQTDFDGQFEFFNPIALNCNDKESFEIISVEKEGSNITINYKGIIDESISIMLYTVAGQKIFDKNIISKKGTNKYYIRDIDLKPGVYMLMLETTDKVLSKKIVLK